MSQIKALDAIEMLRILGLSVRTEGGKLFVSPAELIDEDVAWMVRTHKAAIIAELLDDSPRWAWLVCLGTHTLETYHRPEKTHAEMQRQYPNAVRIAPLPESMWPHDPQRIEPEKETK